MSTVVSSYHPTSNRNLFLAWSFVNVVVSSYHPTSNRNSQYAVERGEWLYLLIILHQTATGFQNFFIASSCIFLSSYIKPQLSPACPLLRFVVSSYHPTSNRNLPLSLRRTRQVVSSYHPTSNRNLIVLMMAAVELYLLIILHQTATSFSLIFNCSRCIFLSSYIKPQP